MKVYNSVVAVCGGSGVLDWYVFLSWYIRHFIVELRY